jgi:hypothetical protein
MADAWQIDPPLICGRITRTSQSGYPILARAAENPILRPAMSYPDLRDLYLQVLEECVRASLEGGWLEQEVERGLLLITAAAQQDLLTYSNEEFDEASRFVREFAARRPLLVWEQVASVRRSFHH